jgi:hypothetical protein
MEGMLMGEGVKGSKPLATPLMCTASNASYYRGSPFKIKLSAAAQILEGLRGNLKYRILIVVPI